jgi:hypothetical protein
VKGILNMGMRAVGDGVGVVAGKVASRAIPSMLNLGLTGFAGVALQLASGIAAGWAAGKFINRDFGRMVVAGAAGGILEGFAKAANIPVVSATLGDEYDAAMGIWLPGAPAPDQGVGRYLPAGGGMAAWDDNSMSDSVGLPG